MMQSIEKLIVADTPVLDEELFMFIAQRPEVLTERNRDGRTVLQQLIAFKRASLVERLAASSDWELNISNADEAGWTALHQVASLGLSSLLPIVLGAGVNSRTRGGQSAIHYAASKGHTALVERLLQVPEIDVKSADKLGQTALHRAAVLGRTEIATLLLSREPSIINYRDFEGNTAL